MAYTEPASKEDWKVEQDARALIAAEVIKADPDRLKLALEKVKEMQEAEEEEKKALERLANGPSLDYPSMRERKND